MTSCRHLVQEFHYTLRYSFIIVTDGLFSKGSKPMPKRFSFDDVARLPSSADNVAIASRRLPAGTWIEFNRKYFELAHHVLEGHRFAILPIATDEALLSWGFPFGYASRPIVPGDYVCNAKILHELASRNLDFDLPPAPNFYEQITPYVLDPASFTAGKQVDRCAVPRSFFGYRRASGRGVGTRNDIVILGLTSHTAAYVRALEQQLSHVAKNFESIDDIVAVPHTEGSGTAKPHNLDFVLRSLSGFITHPNVGAVLVADDGASYINNDRLHDYMLRHAYPINAVKHQFVTLNGHFESDLKHGASLVKTWLPEVNQMRRQPVALEHLKVALQCGGSDAFSGISGNPLAAWVAKEIIRYGGSANLAETDELIGAEGYILQNVRDLETAQAFLATVERFKERVAWHGHTAEGNPSGGNMYRGLYNIILKSLGAAMKRHPEVRLDAVIPYAARMQEPGFYFMDSPGNDLESIAGQVASGANLIFFITGNGSITNFPFVPTLKFVTTTSRFQLLQHDMDVNAGAYQDGEPMHELGEKTFELAIKVASGQHSAGEKAGHAQVSLWRNWPQTDSRNLRRLLAAQPPAGRPIAITSPETTLQQTFQGIRTSSCFTTDQIGLILPTSLCSGQIARLIANRLDDQLAGPTSPLRRIVALPHTEGCGVSGGNSEAIYTRTLLGYLTHPMVKYALLLEHGCEKTHNDYMSQRLSASGIDGGQFGWASIQLDGGIDRVTEKVTHTFQNAMQTITVAQREAVGFEQLRIALLSTGEFSEEVASSYTEVIQTVVGAGGTAIIPQGDAILRTTCLQQLQPGPPTDDPSIDYAQVPDQPGLHIMHTPNGDWNEILTGLGATGVDMMIAYQSHPMPAHPMIPLIQTCVNSALSNQYKRDMDLCLDGAASTWVEQLLALMVDVASGIYIPKLFKQGNTDFQITRGLLGVSL